MNRYYIDDSGNTVEHPEGGWVMHKDAQVLEDANHQLNEAISDMRKALNRVDSNIIVTDPMMLLDEVRAAEEQFSGGYVGLGYFINKWRSSQLTPSPTVRQNLIDDLRDEGLVEIYVAPDGFKAIRST